MSRFTQPALLLVSVPKSVVVAAEVMMVEEVTVAVER